MSSFLTARLSLLPLLLLSLLLLLLLLCTPITVTCASPAASRPFQFLAQAVLSPPPPFVHGHATPALPSEEESPVAASSPSSSSSLSSDDDSFPSATVWAALFVVSLIGVILFIGTYLAVSI